MVRAVGQVDDAVAVGVRRDMRVGGVEDPVAVGVQPRAKKIERARRIQRRVARIGDTVVVLVDPKRVIEVVGIQKAVAVGVGVDHGGQRKGANDEQVVVVVTFQAELGLVRIDDELVVARTAVDHHRRADARAQPAARGGDEFREHVVRFERAAELGRLCIVRVEATRCGWVVIPLRAENLADLEGVETVTAVELGGRAIVVGSEVVVTGEAVDVEPSVERCVVVDALHFGRHVVRVQIAVQVEVAVQQRHESRPVGDFHVDIGRAAGRVTGLQRRDVLRCAQQEDVVGRVLDQILRVADVAVLRRFDAVDRRFVDAVVLGAGIEDVDDVVAPVLHVSLTAGSVHRVVIGLGLAVEGERVAGRDVHRQQPVDGEAVLAVRLIRRRCVLAAVDLGLTVEVGFVKQQRIDVGVAEDARDVRMRRRAAHQRTRTVGAEEGGVGAEARVEVDVVEEDVDPLSGLHHGVAQGADGQAGSLLVDEIVADAQLDPAGGIDLVIGRGTDVLKHVLEEPHRAGVVENQILVQVGAIAHRQADVIVGGLRQHKVQAVARRGRALRMRWQHDAGRRRGVGLGDVDAVGRAQAHVARRVDLRIDVQVVGQRRVHIAEPGDGADRSAVGEDVDRVSFHVPRRVPGAVGARIEDGAVLRGQRNIALGVHRVHHHLAGAARFPAAQQPAQLGAAQDLGEVDALGVEPGLDVVCLQHPEVDARAVEQVDVDLEEVPLRADPTRPGLVGRGAGDLVVAGGHGDVDTGDVGFRSDAVVQRVDNAPRRGQRHVAGRGGDAADAQVVGLFGQRDVTVGQHVDVVLVARILGEAGADDLGDAQHVDDFRADSDRFGRRKNDVLARGDARQPAVALARKGADVVGAVDVDRAAAEGARIQVGRRPVRRVEEGIVGLTVGRRVGGITNLHAPAGPDRGFPYTGLQQQVGSAAGFHGVDGHRIGPRLAFVPLHVEVGVAGGFDGEALRRRQRVLLGGRRLVRIKDDRCIRSRQFRELDAQTIRRRDNDVVAAADQPADRIGAAVVDQLTAEEQVTAEVNGAVRIARPCGEERGSARQPRGIDHVHIDAMGGVLADIAQRCLDIQDVGTDERQPAIAAGGTARLRRAHVALRIAHDRRTDGVLDRAVQQHEASAEVLDVHQRWRYRAQNVVLERERRRDQVDDRLVSVIEHVDVVDLQVLVGEVGDPDLLEGVPELPGTRPAAVGDCRGFEVGLARIIVENVVDGDLAVAVLIGRRPDGVRPFGGYIDRLDDLPGHVDQQFGRLAGENHDVGAEVDVGRLRIRLDRAVRTVYRQRAQARVVRRAHADRAVDGIDVERKVIVPGHIGEIGVGGWFARPRRYHGVNLAQDRRVEVGLVDRVRRDVAEQARRAGEGISLRADALEAGDEVDPLVAGDRAVAAQVHFVQGVHGVHRGIARTDGHEAPAVTLGGGADIELGDLGRDRHGTARERCGAAHPG